MGGEWCAEFRTLENQKQLSRTFYTALSQMFHSNSYMRQLVPALRLLAIVKTHNAYPKSEEILSFTIYNIIS